jgi:hypothetical protein
MILCCFDVHFSDDSWDWAFLMYLLAICKSFKKYLFGCLAQFLIELIVLLLFSYFSM